MNTELISNITKNYFESTSDNVVGVAYGYKFTEGKMTDEQSILFMVNKKLPLDEIPQEELLPKIISLSGETFTTDVIEMNIQFIQAQCPSDFYDWEINPPTNRDKIRPIVGGISTANFTSGSNTIGTLGFVAVDSITNSLVGVSAAHIFTANNSIIASEQNPTGTTFNVVNNFITQPNEISNNGMQNAIGIVKRYYPLSVSGYNAVDVALTTLNEADISPIVSYQQQGMTGWTSPLTFATSEEINGILASSTNLFSSGRTTGPKGEGNMKLRLNGSMITLSVPEYLQGNQVNVNFINCISFVASASTTPNGNICPDPAAPGDSGSALVADINGTRKIIGLVFASGSVSGQTYYGFANRIDEIANAIAIEPWTGGTVSYSNTGATQTNLEIGLSPNVITAPGGNIYWLAGTVRN